VCVSVCVCFIMQNVLFCDQKMYQNVFVIRVLPGCAGGPYSAPRPLAVLRGESWRDEVCKRGEVKLWEEEGDSLKCPLQDLSFTNECMHILSQFHEFLSLLKYFIISFGVPGPTGHHCLQPLVSKLGKASPYNSH